MRCAQLDTASGVVLRTPFDAVELTLSWYPLGSYSPRGTITSQQLRTWPSLSVSPQPSPCDWVLVTASNCTWPVPSEPVIACWISLESDWPK